MASIKELEAEAVRPAAEDVLPAEEDTYEPDPDTVAAVLLLDKCRDLLGALKEPEIRVAAGKGFYRLIVELEHEVTTFVDEWDLANMIEEQEGEL